MILPRYHIGASLIPGAGKGLFLDEPARVGQILVAPDDIRKVYKWNEIEALPNAGELLAATVRWFGDCYTISTDWPDECYVNHAFEPNGLWHLGFNRDLLARWHHFFLGIEKTKQCSAGCSGSYGKQR